MRRLCAPSWAYRMTIAQTRAPRDSPHLEVDTAVRKPCRQCTVHGRKVDGILWARSRDLYPGAHSERTDRITCAIKLSNDDGRIWEEK